MKKNIFISLLLAFALSIIPMGTMHAMEQQQNTPESSVSLIYYPSFRLIGSAGHAEVEINGTVYNRMILMTSRPLNNLIEDANSGGQPFLRFVFDVDTAAIPSLLAEIQKNAAWYSTCSFGAVSPLRNAGICSIPAPLSISPLIMASYLALSNTLRLDKIKEIEYYGDPSLLHILGLDKIQKTGYTKDPSLLNSLRIMPGLLVESGLIISNVSNAAKVTIDATKKATSITDERVYAAINTLVSERLSALISSGLALGWITFTAIKAFEKMSHHQTNQEQSHMVQSSEKAIQNHFNAFRKAANSPLFKIILSTLY